MDRAGIIVDEVVPSSDEHYRLRKEGGLTPPPQPENESALARSWYSITLRNDAKEAIGMGRITGDGMFLIIVDVVVLPAYHRRGLGNMIMERLLQHVDQHAPKARVALEADPPGVGLYQKHGFQMQTYSKPMIRSTYWPKGPPE